MQPLLIRKTHYSNSNSKSQVLGQSDSPWNISLTFFNCIRPTITIWWSRPVTNCLLSLQRKRENDHPGAHITLKTYQTHSWWGAFHRLCCVLLSRIHLVSWPTKVWNRSAPIWTARTPSLLGFLWPWLTSPRARWGFLARKFPCVRSEWRVESVSSLWPDPSLRVAPSTELVAYVWEREHTHDPSALQLRLHHWPYQEERCTLIQHGWTCHAIYIRHRRRYLLNIMWVWLEGVPSRRGNSGNVIFLPIYGYSYICSQLCLHKIYQLRKSCAGECSNLILRGSAWITRAWLSLVAA